MRPPRAGRRRGTRRSGRVRRRDRGARGRTEWGSHPMNDGEGPERLQNLARGIAASRPSQESVAAPDVAGGEQRRGGLAEPVLIRPVPRRGTTRDQDETPGPLSTPVGPARRGRRAPRSPRPAMLPNGARPRWRIGDDSWRARSSTPECRSNPPGNPGRRSMDRRRRQCAPSCRPSSAASIRSCAFVRRSSPTAAFPSGGPLSLPPSPRSAARDPLRRPDLEPRRISPVSAIRSPSTVAAGWRPFEPWTPGAVRRARGPARRGGASCRGGGGS